MKSIWIVVAASVAVMGCGAEAQKKAADAAVTTEAQAAVSAQLIDPSSPLFTDVSVSEDGLEVCGYVNGKNRLGAYAGRKRFVWVKGGSAIIEIDPGIAPDSLAARLNACVFDASFQSCRGSGDAGAITRCSTDLLP